MEANCNTVPCKEWDLPKNRHVTCISMFMMFYFILLFVYCILMPIDQPRDDDDLTSKHVAKTIDKLFLSILKLWWSTVCVLLYRNPPRYRTSKLYRGILMYVPCTLYSLLSGPTNAQHICVLIFYIP